MAFSARAHSNAISTINVTPLVDVLLVLLIIFMITAPVVTHRTGIDLPYPGHSQREPQIDPIRLAIRADGSLYWNDVPVDRTQLRAELAVAAQQASPPRLSIRVADGAAYEAVARVLADVKAQGLGGIDLDATP
jgi:biopolymer transport protein ExbD